MGEAEGILINKFPYQEKNIIAHLLLRSGMKTSVIFYGGQGGGKKHKSSILQIGYLFKFNYMNSKSNTSMLTAKEYKEKWFHQNISGNTKGFYLLCFFCEFIEKFAIEIHDVHDITNNDDSHVGFFRLLSNAIFNLEKALSSEDACINTILLTFLAKASYELGIFPRTENCAISGEILEGDDIFLSSEHGGFAYKNFLEEELKRQYSNENGNILRLAILDIVSKKYGEVSKVPNIDKSHCRRLFEYICYQQNVNTSSFKTSSLIFH